jgi:two-component system, NtrC family, response regulator AtoC
MHSPTCALVSVENPGIFSMLSTAGYAIRTADGIDAGLSLLDDADVSVMVTSLASSEGFELCRAACQKQPGLPVVGLAPDANMETAVQAMRAGATDVFTDFDDLAGLTPMVKRAVERARTRSALRLLDDQPIRGVSPGMLGESSAFRRLLTMVNRIAHSDTTVLITGESGTGKEVVARAIHEASARVGRFVALNCAAMPEALLESELFGHVQGAFTDAKHTSPGLFLEANQGTLFLDEIGEMSLQMQAKLLRSLEERRVRPVGGTRETPFDARLVVATNRDLELMVQERHFREDLFYRINVIGIDVPPLRERCSDILLLAHEFLNRAAARAGKPVTRISPAAADKLQNYSFPGNVRELLNAIERSVALTRTDEIGIDDLPQAIRESRTTAHAALAEQKAALPSMRDVETEYIRYVLGTVGGNKTRAAKILGLDRRTLYRRATAEREGNAPLSRRSKRAEPERDVIAETIGSDS